MSRWFGVGTGGEGSTLLLVGGEFEEGSVFCWSAGGVSGRLDRITAPPNPRGIANCCD